MNSWQKRHAALGLCIFCTRRGVPGNGKRAPKCKIHREAIRRLNGYVKPYLSHAERKKRRIAISRYALEHPFSDIKQIAGKFQMSGGFVTVVLKQNKVVPGWRKVRRVT
jgi:hypothetical protein